MGSLREHCPLSPADGSALHWGAGGRAGSKAQVRLAHRTRPHALRSPAVTAPGRGISLRARWPGRLTRGFPEGLHAPRGCSPGTELPPRGTVPSPSSCTAPRWTSSERSLGCRWGGRGVQGAERAQDAVAPWTDGRTGSPGPGAWGRPLCPCRSPRGPRASAPRGMGGPPPTHGASGASVDSAVKWAWARVSISLRVSWDPRQRTAACVS